MKQVVSGLAGVAALMIPGQSMAQTAPPNVGNPPRQEAPVAALNGDLDAIAIPITSGAPNDRTMTGFHVSSLQFTTERGETAISGALSFDLSSYDPTATAEKRGGYFVVSRTKLGISGSTPIDGEAQSAPFLTGDSIVSGTKLKFSVTNFRSTLGTGEGTRPILAKAYRRCINKFAGPKGVRQGTFATLLSDIDTAENGIGPGGTVTFESAFKKPGNEAVAKACFPGIDGGTFQTEGDLVAKFEPGLLDDYDRGFFPSNTSMRFMGLDGSIGWDDHEFLDRPNFAKLTEQRTSWEVGGYIGWITSDTRSSIRFRAIYGQMYLDNDKAEICRTVSIPAGTECIEGPDGAPVRTGTGLVSVEGRLLISLPSSTDIAIAPQITYRTQDRNVGIEVPVYLSPGADGRLTGGIKAAYNSKDDEFTFGLFVGVPFSVFFDP